MAEWTLIRNSKWYICADGKPMAECNEEEDAQLLLKAIISAEKAHQDKENSP